MTIAACYLTTEGVVLGADSTTTEIRPVGTSVQFRFWNHAQKVFEVGEGSTIGIVTWGATGFQDFSHRALIASLADDLAVAPPKTMKEIADRWAQIFSNQFEATYGGHLAPLRAALKDPNPSPEQEKLIQEGQQLPGGGYCVAGYLPMLSRRPEAYTVEFHPTAIQPKVEPLAPNRGWFWGAPRMMERMFIGLDGLLANKILNSGQWSGTEDELWNLAFEEALGWPGNIPLREALDYIHSFLHLTIKMMKFSPLQPVCGGPIELAVISADRPFRWVRHKAFDSAIAEVEP